MSSSKALFLTALALAAVPHADPLTIFFVDPGYEQYSGDAMLVCTPTGGHYVVDGGDRGGSPPWDCGEARLLPLLDSLEVTSLDGIVATHPHSDHVGGLVALLEAMPVGTVWDSGWPYSPTPAYEEFLEAVESSSASYVVARRGMELDWGPGLEVEVLHPVDPLDESEMNNVSIVLRITHGQVSFLLAADLYTEGGEDAILEAVGSGIIETVEADVLKVGHHGSSTSTSTAWLAAVDPEWAAIEVGAGNPYGHPHDEVIARLLGRGIDIFRTDLNGTFYISTDGQDLYYNSLPDTGGGGEGWEGLQAYPSPASTHVTFEWNSGGTQPGPFCLAVYNLLGEKVLDTMVSGNSCQWDFSLESGSLASPGLYTAVVESADGGRWTECFAIVR